MTAAPRRIQSTSAAPVTPPGTLATRGPGAAGTDFAALLARQAEPGAPGTPRLGDTEARQRATARAADAAPQSRPQPSAAARDEAPAPMPAKAPAGPAARAPAPPPQKTSATESDTREPGDGSRAPRATPSEDTGDVEQARSSESETESEPLETGTGDAVLTAWLQWPGAARTQPIDTGAEGEVDPALGVQDPGLDTGAAMGSTDALQVQSAADAAASSAGASAANTTLDGTFAAAMLGASDAGLRATAGRRGGSQIEGPNTAALAGLGATAPSPLAGGAAAPTASAPSIPLGTAPGQPDFAETVSMHLSQLAKDGKHEATLTLNPAELGSIAVRIALDGHQTQVDFSASSASTRELLQTHLGELARALQDAGLQMTGGGVRDQARGQASDGRGPGVGRTRVGGIESATPAPDTPVPARAVTAGRLDLFA